MRIVIDAYPIRVRSAGIGTYTREMVTALARIAPGHEYYLADAGPRFVPIATTGDIVRAVNRATGDASLMWKALPVAIREAIARRELGRVGADIYFATNFLGVFRPSVSTVITIHDLAHVQAPDNAYPPMARRLARNLARHADRARAIVTDSLHSRNDVVKHLSVPAFKVHVAYPGVSDRFKPIADAEARRECRARYGLPDRFALFVGTIEPRKNLVRLIEAFDLLVGSSTPLNLVLVGGRGWRDSAIHQAIRSSAGHSRIVLTGRVADEDLPTLYSMAEVFALPSLHEGFGMPVIEAMACGTPVVTSNASALPEAAGDAAVLVDPLSARSIAEGIRAIVADPDLAQRLRRAGLERARGFGWDHTGRAVLDVFSRVAHSPGAGKRQPPERGTKT